MGRYLSRGIFGEFWKTCHVRYHPGHVWRVLQQLGWSRQRPVRGAKERNQAAIARWLRVRWPQVKKTPGDRTPG